MLAPTPGNSLLFFPANFFIIAPLMSPKPPSKTKRDAGNPVPACPGCGMVKNTWPGEGYTQDNQNYCCQGCAEDTGCVCRQTGEKGFSRSGQETTKAQPRAGKQRSGAPAPAGELSGERDATGNEEGIDEPVPSNIIPRRKPEDRPGTKTPAAPKTKSAAPGRRKGPLLQDQE